MNVKDRSVDNGGWLQSGGGAPIDKSPKLGLKHSLVRERYLFRVDLYLEGRVQPRIRKRILADLRESIDADVENSSLRQTLDGLGKPRELAASYTEGVDQSRPLWAAGLVAALCTLMVYWLFLFTFVFGMLAVAMQVGGEFHARFFFLEVMAFSGDNGVGVGWTGNAALWFPLVLAAVPFLLASRAWRVFGRSRS